MRRESTTPDRDRAFRAALRVALQAGYEILDGGGTAVDAVTAAVRVLEDDSLFNAGKGAVFTNQGTNELDAAIMDGATLQAGAVAGVKRVKNPISLARLVMEESPHVFLVGEGAEAFGREHGIEEVDPSYFYSEENWRSLQDARGDAVMGTVGAVARDREGHLAAATSTGGMTNKLFGRVGDAPVIGAGTYASDASCAVSATGHGEFFIRNVVAREVCARLEYLGESLQEAAHEIIMERLVEQGGDGGMIGIDRDGHIALITNTHGMHRGHWMAGAEPFTALYADEGQAP